MEKIQAIIFDIDGTLADTVPLIIAAFRKAVEPLVKRPLSDKEIIDSFGPDEEGSVRAIVPDDCKKGTADFLQYYESMHSMCTQPFKGIVTLLEKLQQKEVHIAIATGKGKQTSDFTLSLLKIKSFFEQIENGSPKGSRKIEAIHQLLQTFDNVSGESVIYVGDSPNDIKESREAGVKSIAACWSDSAEKEKLLAAKPDEMFYTVEDFSIWLMKYI